MKSFNLTGVNIFNKPCSIQQVSQVVSFVSEDQYLEIKSTEAGSGYLLVTPKGSYVLTKHPTLNIWTTVANGHKVHATIKKLVATLRYW